MALALILELRATLGAGFNLFRRLCEACWLLAGLVVGGVLAREEKTARRRNPDA